MKEDKKRLKELKHLFLKRLGNDLDEIFDYYKQEVNRDTELFFKYYLNDTKYSPHRIDIPSIKDAFTDEEIEELKQEV